MGIFQTWFIYPNSGQFLPKRSYFSLWTGKVEMEKFTSDLSPFDHTSPINCGKDTVFSRKLNFPETKNSFAFFFPNSSWCITARANGHMVPKVPTAGGALFLIYTRYWRWLKCSWILQMNLLSNKQRKAKTSGKKQNKAKQTNQTIARVRQVFVAGRNVMTYFGEKIKPQPWWSPLSQESLQGVKLSSQESVKLREGEGRKGGMNEHSFSTKLRCQEQN